MRDNTYDTTYLYDTLFLLEKELEELTTWSVYNNDVQLDQISQLRQNFERVKKVLFLVGKRMDEKGGENNE